MLDKIVISSSNKEARMIFTDRDSVRLSSDKDIREFILWMFTEQQPKQDNNDELTVAIDSDSI